MKTAISLGLTCLALGTAAHAAGVERSTQSVGILFEEGTHAELSFGHVSPTVSGVQVIDAGPSPAGASSGNMSGDYTTVSLGFKTQLSDQFAMALVIDEPIGANVDYAAGTGYLYGGSTAILKSDAVTVLGKYTLPSNFSLIAGLRAQRTSGDVALFNGYRLLTSNETDLGYVFGVAYERPEIALRVALTYNSAIDHVFSITENGAPSLPLDVEIPESLHLEFQTGVAEDTLVFGSLRYVDWTAFRIAPVGYVAAAGSPLVRYNGDTTSITLGVGRRFNESWSGAATIGYEDPNGGFSGNLGPTDGTKSIGLAVTYEKDRYKITGGVRYIDLGNARTMAPRPFPPGTEFSSFRDNHAIAAGLKLSVKF